MSANDEINNIYSYSNMQQIMASIIIRKTRDKKDILNQSDQSGKK
jgi:hypothetical protein